MNLYNHVLKKGGFELFEIPVRETEKMFVFERAQTKLTGTHLNRIRKENLGKVYEIMGGHSVIYESQQKEKFLREMMEMQKSQEKRLQKELDRAKERIGTITREINLLASTN